MRTVVLGMGMVTTTTAMMMMMMMIIEDVLHSTLKAVRPILAIDTSLK